MFPVDVPNGLDHVGELGTVLIQLPHLPNLPPDVPHHLLQLLQRLQPLLHPIQLGLDRIAQLGFNRGLQQTATRFEGKALHGFIASQNQYHPLPSSPPSTENLARYLFSCYLPLVLIQPVQSLWFLRLKITTHDSARNGPKWWVEQAYVQLVGHIPLC